MTKERFVEILKEYEFPDDQIDVIWDMRPSDDLNEETIRTAAMMTASMKESALQN